MANNGKASFGTIFGVETRFAAEVGTSTFVHSSKTVGPISEVFIGDCSAEVDVEVGDKLFEEGIDSVGSGVRVTL